MQVLQPIVLDDCLGNAAFAVAAKRQSLPVGERAVVLDEPFERFPGQVETVEGRIAALQRRHHPQRLRVVIETAEGAQALVKRPLASVAERRMAEIVRQSQRLGQILVKVKRAGERACHLRHFERVGQARPVVIALVEHEDLRLVLEAAKGRRMDDAVAIAAERVAVFAGGLRVKPAPAFVRIARVARPARCAVHGHQSARLSAVQFGQLTLAFAALNYRGDAVAIGAIPGRKEGK